MASRCRVGKDGEFVAESEDQGKTWFCRWKLSGVWGSEYTAGYKDMCQTQDGIIHLIGWHGTSLNKGDNPHMAFTEQWLREKPCLDVSNWGINTKGRISPCPTEDTMQYTGVGIA